MSESRSRAAIQGGVPLRIDNQTRQRTLAVRAEEATTFWRRTVGLLGRRELEPGGGLHIVPCNSIHMFFMRFPIDAVFIDEEHRVVRVVPMLTPWRVVPYVPRARSVIELPAGVVELTGTAEDDRLTLDRTDDAPRRAVL